MIDPTSTPTRRIPPGLLVGIVLAGVVICALAFWAGLQWNALNRTTSVPPTTTEPQADEQTTDVTPQPPPDIYTNLGLPQAKEWLTINWLPLDQQTVAIHQTVAPTDPSDPSATYFDPALLEEQNWPRDFTLGSVQGGTYDGYTLLLKAEPQGGMGISTLFSYILHDLSGKPDVHLGRYDSWLSFNIVAGQVASVDIMNPDTENADIGIAEFEQPAAVGVVRTTVDAEQPTFVYIGPGARIDYPLIATASGDPNDPNPKIDWGTYPVESFPVVAGELEGGREFRMDPTTQSFFTVRVDGRLEWYDTWIPFWDGLDKPAASRQYGIPDVILNGEENHATYLKGQYSGCGFSNFSHVRTAEEIGPMEKIGSFSANGASGDLFGPASFDGNYYKAAFNNWLASNPGGTVDQFAALTPYFYWKDAFGRWIEFQRSDITPAVECGKPVIYLYPTTTTDLTVHLTPQGGFTKSEPAYNDGWNVTASPDGTLVNKADGLTYPYLFWEGRGGMYQSPANYWVVAKSDVHTFLVGTLARLGLNEKETADFIAFWEPRMTAAPYYKIGFHGTNVMNQIAPLSISQSPNTLIRVLMDYTELSASEPQHPPVLPPTPKRDGFTVIEWGGVLR